MTVSTFHIVNSIGENKPFNTIQAILVSPFFTHELLTIETLLFHQSLSSQLLANTPTVEKARPFICSSIGGSQLL